MGVLTFGTLMDTEFMSASYRTYIPTNEIKSIESLPFKKKTLERCPRAYGAARYALHKCYLASLTSDTEWAPLWSQLMGSIAGNTGQWTLAKNALCAEGYLECDDKCKKGEKSFCFKLGPMLENAKWNYSDKFLSLPADKRPKWQGLELDQELAHKIVDEIAGPRSWNSEVTKCWHTRVDQFSPHYKICKTGRAFSDANQFPKEMRDALVIDGEKTVEIDVVNCQPVLLATIFPEKSPEWERYRISAESGESYEELGAFAGLARDEAKREFIPYIFGGRKPVAEGFFKEEYPELLGAISQRRKEWYKGLAYDLQRKESSVIVDCLCREFRAVSIHDGIRVKQSDAGGAVGRLLELFEERWGLNPRVTIGGEAYPKRSSTLVAA